MVTCEALPAANIRAAPQTKESKSFWKAMMKVHEKLTDIHQIKAHNVIKEAKLKVGVQSVWYHARCFDNAGRPGLGSVTRSVPCPLPHLEGTVVALPVCGWACCLGVNT